MTSLSVNLNKVALLRNQRDLDYPSIVDLGRIALAAGAHGLTVHPRPDGRHIRRKDVFDLAALFASPGGEVEFNIEGYPAEEFLSLVEEVEPDQVTLVPDAPDQRTSDHGWDMTMHAGFLADVVARLKRRRTRVALFIDADPRAARMAAETGADRVELYTGPYHFAFADGRAESILPRYRAAADAAAESGLRVNAGHDLNLFNLGRFLAAIPNVCEVSIGHALIADALVMGMADAVRAYLRVIAAATAEAAA